MVVAPLSAFAEETTDADAELKLLGKYVFFDKLSVPKGMSCATCHAPEAGGTGGDSNTNLHQVGMTGADGHSVGGLKPPTNAYASLIAPFNLCSIGGVSAGGQQFCGGNFWNGRAEGVDPALLDGATRHIGPEVFQGSQDARLLGYAKYFGPTSDQALNPMPNPVEQNIPRKAVCELVAKAGYAPLYQLAWGEPINCCDDVAAVQALDVDTPERAYDISFKRLMLAVGAWQASSDLNSFSSKRDLALRAELACLNGAADADPLVCNHPDYLASPGKFPLVGFTAQENLGHDLFYNTAFPRGTAPFPSLPVTNCSFCHRSDTTNNDGTGLLERYADDAYHNIGVPVNPELPAAANPGLSGHAGLPAPQDAGGFKTATLRNVDKRKDSSFVKAYTHNGWFKSLESLVHFYNTSRVKPRCEGAVSEAVALANDCWPAPEWPTTLSNSRLVGALGLNADQEAALVAYLKTLSDTHTSVAPAPYKDSGKDKTKVVTVDKTVTKDKTVTIDKTVTKDPDTGKKTVTIDKTVTVNKTVNIDKTITIDKPTGNDKVVTVNKTVSVDKTVNVDKTVTKDKASNDKTVTVNRTVNVDKTVSKNKTVTVDKTVNKSKTVNMSSYDDGIDASAYSDGFDVMSVDPRMDR